MYIPSIDELFKAGAHFGHRTNRWNPKMKPFIFGAKKGVYIIDLPQTQDNLKVALNFIQKLVKEGKSILFVGTKNQAKVMIKETAQTIEMPYVCGKWLGGYITNFAIIRKSIKKYHDLLAQKESGKLDKYTKKERLAIDREMKKLEARVGGLGNLNKLPDALFVWDIKVEKTAIEEARKKHLPIIAICDTNVDPTPINYVIPANDDSSKTVKVIMSAVKDAVLEAKTAEKKN